MSDLQKSVLLLAFLASASWLALLAPPPAARPETPNRSLLAAHEVDLLGAPPPGPWRWRGKFDRAAEYAVGDEVAASFLAAPDGLRAVLSASGRWVPSAFDFSGGGQ